MKYDLISLLTTYTKQTLFLIIRLNSNATIDQVHRTIDVINQSQSRAVAHSTSTIGFRGINKRSGLKFAH